MSLQQRLSQRMGQRLMQRIGTAGAANPLVPIWVRSYGQSNDIGEDDANAGGSSSRPSADRGYNSFTANPKTVQRLLYSQALVGSGQQTFTDTGTTGGVTYAAAGVVNVGFWRRIPDILQQYGGYATAGISLECPVLGASLRRNLMPGATDGRNIFNQSMARLDADIAIYRSQPACEVFIQGETDASDTTDASQYQANLTAYIAAVRAHLGNPTFPFFLVKVNPNLSAGSFPFLATVRAAQDAVAAADSNVIIVSLDDYFPFLTTLHYAANELYDGAERIAFAIMRKLTPGFTGNLGSGPGPWLQGIGAGVTAQASPNTASPRSGPDDTNGDLHLLFGAAATVATTISMPTTAAGYTQALTIESVFSTSHRRMSLFTRTADTTTINANSGHMPAPVVDFGACTLNVCGVARVRSAGGTAAIHTTATGVNNGNTTGVTIGGFTTTVPNCLAVCAIATGGNTNALNALATTGLTWTIQRTSQFNPGAGTIELAYATAPVPNAGTYGTTVATLAATGVNTGIIAVVQP